jgi:hypothetical protein
MKNAASNEIDTHGVFTSGGDVGFVAILVASAIPVLLAPLFMADVDVWTFWKSMSTVLLDESYARPATGFEAGPVLVGIGIHLFVGALIGALFAVVVAYFDIDTLAPTVVVTAFMLSVLAIDLTWIPLSHTLLPALDNISIVFTGSMLVWFGIMLGFGIQRWRRRWDETQCPTATSTRRRWLFVAHERALVATVGTLALIAAGVLIVGTDALRPGAAIPYLVVHVAATMVVIVHTISEARELDKQDALHS